MATIKKLRDRKGLHIETDGCIVNIREGLHDWKGRKVTAIEILPDHYSGDFWKVTPQVCNVRVIQLKTK